MHVYTAIALAYNVCIIMFKHLVLVYVILLVFFFTKTTLITVLYYITQALPVEQAEYCMSKMPLYVDSNGLEIRECYNYKDFTKSLF